MESLDRMREEFEAWQCEADDGPLTDPMWLEHRNGDDYALDVIQREWKIWQASRACLVVTLPAMTNNGYEGFYLAHAVDKAIKAVGAKIEH